MNTTRRNFLRNTTLGAGILFSSVTGYASVEQLDEAVTETFQKGKNRKQVFNMSGFTVPPIPMVRIGYVGIGSRGGAAVTRMTNIEGVEIKALCDIREEAVNAGQETLKKAGWPEARLYFGDDQVWKKMCESDDIDLIYIATSWKWHTPIAVYAMEHGKHVAVEVPAARNLEECWQLVETAERTRRHCMQLENCCYDFFEMLTLNMSRQGAFGELIHAEGAYIHYRDNFRKNETMWRLRENFKSGNLYPTHGLGPVCQALNVNRGDRLEYMVSMSTDDFQMGAQAKELAEKDSFYREFVGKPFRGNMNTSVIRTYKGKTIMVQHDVTSPRVYDRKHLLSGTKGMAQKYPLPGKIAFGHEWVAEEEMKQIEEKYSPELIRHIGDIAKSVGGHGGMDFTMDWRLIDCLHNGLPLDIDIYDAALWCSLTPLSIWSVANNSGSIKIPDFTAGYWKSGQPLELKLKGATTGVIKR